MPRRRCACCSAKDVMLRGYPGEQKCTKSRILKKLLWASRVSNAAIDRPPQYLFRKPPAIEEMKRLAEKGPGYHRGVYRAQLELLEKGEALPTAFTAPFTVWQFGQDLTLVGFPGEVVVDFLSMTERELGPLKLWVSAYNNDVFGYLPSARVLEEGGYECRGSYYGPPGIFSKDAETVVMKKIVELARKAGRPALQPGDVRRR